MLSSFRRRFWPDQIESCSINICIPITSSEKTSEKSRADPEERRRRQRKETPQPSKNKLFTNRKKQDEIKPEQMDHGSKEECSGFEAADTSFW